ncbi:MAG TPA: 6-phosphogluconolactonase [Bacteroidales bacterium]|nr:6-phosphogluconolactonase [Bacteroidales bacterium]
MTAYTVNYKDIATAEVFDSLSVMTSTFLHRLSLDIMRAAGNGNEYYVALSGGTTPFGIFKRTPLGWGSPFLLRRLMLYWGDERCVAPDSEESNYGNTHREWLNKIGIPAENVNRIMGENDPQQEAQRYASLLRKMPQKNGLPQFDLVLLGIGEDGHTASIFPDYADLLHSRELVAVTKHPGSGQNRITLTGPVINNAKNVLFLATGERKIPVLKDVFSDSEKARGFPAYHIRPEGDLRWYLDTASGSWYKK